MKEIKLSRQGKYKVRYTALVDDEDYEYLNKLRWSVKVTKKDTLYARTLIYGNEKHTYIYMHRLIMNTPDNLQVDHIDHNGLNNQKSNLRNCTPKQNKQNRKPYGKSKYLGVKFIGKYIIAEMGNNNKKTYLGSFKTETEAAMAYDKKAKETYGEFANLNFK